MSGTDDTGAGARPPRPQLTIEEVERVAELARVHLSPEERERALEDLARIVGYVAQLQEVDTRGVEPLHHVLDLKNVLRDDVPEPSLPVEEALRNAPARKGNLFLLPKVIRRGADSE